MLYILSLRFLEMNFEVLSPSYELKNNSWPRQITRDFSGGSMLEGSDTTLVGEEKQVKFKLNMILTFPIIIK